MKPTVELDGGRWSATASCWSEDWLGDAAQRPELQRGAERAHRRRAGGDAALARPARQLSTSTPSTTAASSRWPEAPTTSSPPTWRRPARGRADRPPGPPGPASAHRRARRLPDRLGDRRRRGTRRPRPPAPAAEGIAELGIPSSSTATWPRTRSAASARTSARRARGAEPADGVRRADPRPGAVGAAPDAGRDAGHREAPLVAFNIELGHSQPRGRARRGGRAARVRGRAPGVRALGLPRDGDRCQVSTNVHDAEAVPLSKLVEEVRRLAAEHGARPVEAELVGWRPPSPWGLTRPTRRSATSTRAST
jgi:hypothetical protein